MPQQNSRAAGNHRLDATAAEKWVYVTRGNELLHDIARTYGITASDLIRANPGIRDVYVPPSGTALVIPLDKTNEVFTARLGQHLKDERRKRLIRWSTMPRGQVAGAQVKTPPAKLDIRERGRKGLRDAKKDEASVRRALAEANVLKEAGKRHGIDWRILAAMSIRETGFQNIAQQSGPGRAGGYFQIDFNAHPEISKEQAFDIKWAADWTAKQIAADVAKYQREGFTRELSTAGAIRNHNTGSKYTLEKLKKDAEAGGFANLDRGTWQSNYVTNVLDIVECFQP